MDTGITNAEYSNGVLTLTQTGNSSKLIFTGLTSHEEALKENDTDTTIAYVNVLFDNSTDASDDANPVKTSIAKAKSVINVSDSTAEDDFAKAYVGNGSGVDFSKFDDSVSLEINLEDGKGTLNSNGDSLIAFRGINSIQGSDGTHTLIGSLSEKYACSRQWRGNYLGQRSFQ